ncbi:MAG: hypothetical protein ACRDTR_13195 [Rubrobacter sp.]
MVRVLVGKKEGDRFPGFWAEFEGEKVGSYEDTRGERSIVYTLYRCTAYDWEAYRVHIADESNPVNPVYELLPYTEGPNVPEVGPDYAEPYAREQIAARYPLFLKDMDYFPERLVDPGPRTL